MVHWDMVAPSMFIKLLPLLSPMLDDARVLEPQVGFDRRERAQLESEVTPVIHSPEGTEKLDPPADPWRYISEDGSSELPVGNNIQGNKKEIRIANIMPGLCLCLFYE